MGIDLCILGNHTIEFSGKTFLELYSEIKHKLDNMSIENYTYIKYAKLLWDNGEVYGVEEMEKIKQKKEWTVEDDYAVENFNEDGTIEFYGPLNLEIDFTKYYISFGDPPYRYKSWFEFESIHQNEWRKYLYYVVHYFGGDRVIYLPDSGIPSSEFAFYDGTINELEYNLKKRYGKSKNNLSEVTNEYYENYFIDKFDDIDWSKNAPIDYYFPKYFKWNNSGYGGNVEKFDPNKFKMD
jgi:hypothetical protein